MKAGQPQRGFTLLELLIALGIFGIMSVMAYGGLAAVIDTREQVSQAMDRLAQMQRAVHRIQSDVESAQQRPIRDEFGDLRPALLWDSSEFALELTRGGWRNPLKLPRSSLERVAYFLNEDRLVRRSWRVLDRPQDPIYIDTVLLEQVEELTVRFLQEKDDWQTEWPPANVITENPPLPKAIELNIKTKDWQTIRLLLRVPPGAGQQDAST